MPTSARSLAVALGGTALVVLAAGGASWAIHKDGGPSRVTEAAAARASHSTLTARPARPDSPAPRPAVPVDPLGAAARSFLSTRSGTVSAAVYDARSGMTWTIGQGRPQAEASIVKVDILETLLARRHSDGATLPARDKSLAAAMIEDSDNAAATALWDEVGGAHGISSFNASAGLTDTTPSSCVACPGFAWPGWGLSTTTATDQLALLRELLRPNSLLTDAQRTYALSLMEHVTAAQAWGVASGMRTRTTVALKNGWLPLTSADDDWQINSIGWVAGQGRDYLMAVLSTGNPTEQYGIDTVDKLAGIVWRQLR
jgi:Beta-lactamase enzyme family